MKKVFIFLCLAAFAAPAAPAKDKSSSKPKRTLKELIDLTMERGEEKVITKEFMQGLGFTGAANTKRIEYEYLKSKHIAAAHAFDVVYSTTSDGNTQLIALIWGPIEINSKKSKKFYDGWSFRTGMDGKLQNAAHASGYSGDVTQKPVSIRSSKVKEMLKLEMDFFLDKDQLLGSKK